MGAGIMTNTGAATSDSARAQTAEVTVRDFARQYPTPNTLRGLAYCERGEISWQAMSELCARALTAGMSAVAGKSDALTH